MKFKCKYPCTKNCPQTRTKLGESSFFAEVFQELFRMCPDIKILALQVAIKNKFSLKISKDIARRAKDEARSKLEGDHAGQFRQLWDYGHELKRTHSGSTIIIYYEKGFEMNNENRIRLGFLYQTNRRDLRVQYAKNSAIVNTELVCTIFTIISRRITRVET
ncbi:hypothetical protein LIER_34932 [Lithospermum erythrorhizon]|uniref:Uncharacterized protein n=1 Tax=Lithospermum erythrorhizon TaxID=34254 RepID=A0AAV3NGJ3_LITER